MRNLTSSGFFQFVHLFTIAKTLHTAQTPPTQGNTCSQGTAERHVPEVYIIMEFGRQELFFVFAPKAQQRVLSKERVPWMKTNPNSSKIIYIDDHQHQQQQDSLHR